MVWSLLFLLGHVTWWVFLVHFYPFRNFRSSAMAFWTALAWTAPSNGLVVSWDDSYFYMFLCSLICEGQEVSTWAQVLLRWYLFHLRRSCARYASVQKALVFFSHMLTVTFTGRMTIYKQQWQKGKDVTRRTVDRSNVLKRNHLGKKWWNQKTCSFQNLTLRKKHWHRTSWNLIFPNWKGRKSMENHVPSSIFMFKKCEFSPSFRCSGTKYACSPFQQGDVSQLTVQ